MSDVVRVNALARAFVAGEQTVESIAARGAIAIGRPSFMVRPVAQRYLDEFNGKTRPRHRDVVEFLFHDRSWLRRKPPSARTRSQATNTGVAVWTTEPARMQPVPVAEHWSVPPIESVAQLAEWLGITVAELEWLSDVKGRVRNAVRPKLHHYHYKIRAKRRGGIRLIEVPQLRLKAIQRRILAEILNQVPSYYSAAHGFVKGRSVRTFAAQHVGQQLVLRMDLQDFFPCISGVRVQALFRTLGYPESVADLLGGLCTNATPRSVFAQPRDASITPEALIVAQRMYSRPHLPQGAPTSPALANLCAHRLDLRLTGLADWAGATYSRYADDLAFSGGEIFARRVERYAAQIAAIALEEGWNVQHHKTRIMRRSVRQHVAGVVVNAKMNVAREDFDTLKAILTNCVRHGPATQNRQQHADFRAHLLGRIAWVSSLNAGKGDRLRAIFAKVDWQSVGTS